MHPWLGAARDHAAGTGWGGARYPWESALTGGEVCPMVAQTTRDNEIHISGDISFAIQQYYALTGDAAWFHKTIQNNSGCDLVREVAEFWVSRAKLNNSTGKYDIEHVMGPDEDHEDVKNNAFTNAVASLAIRFAQTLGLESVCQPVPTEWVTVANNIVIPYDDILDYHPQHAGYTLGTSIKQADTVLLGFPLMWKMSESTRKNDLQIYEKAVRKTGPAMTWSMHAIGHLELGQTQLGHYFFNESYQPYVTKPFYIWTENRQPNFGAVNFATGMGGFLQSVLHGFFGIIIFPGKMIFNPQLPQNSNRMEVHGLSFKKNVLNIIANRFGTMVQVLRLKHTMKISQENDTYFIDKVTNINLNFGLFQIQSIK